MPGRRVVRDALTLAGLVYIALVWLGIAPYAPPVPEYGPMFDARGFWIAWEGGLYDIPWGEYEAYVYSPAFAQLLWPFTLLPWPVFAALWTLAAIGCLFWMRVPWMLAFPGVIDDILRGNIHVFMAAVDRPRAALRRGVGVRHPHQGHARDRPPLARGAARVAPSGDCAWSSPAAIFAISFALSSELWLEWFGLLAENADTTARIRVIPLPLARPAADRGGADRLRRPDRSRLAAADRRHDRAAERVDQLDRAPRRLRRALVVAAERRQAGRVTQPRLPTTRSGHGQPAEVRWRACGRMAHYRRTHSSS